MAGNNSNLSSPDMTGVGHLQLNSNIKPHIRTTASRIRNRLDLVTRLLQEKSTPNGLTAEHLSLPAGTLRKFGGVECSWCPPGQFMMGSPKSEEGRLDNEIQHPVTLTKGFCMSCCPVTQADYQAVVGSNPSRFIGVDCPVEQVTWEEAVEFCCKLTLKQRREGLLPERWEWRLPTEAEWEYAARAGTTGPRYGDLDAVAWYVDNSGRQTHPVKQKTANPWGLYDMLGNVSEWCSDWEGDYPTVSVTNPLGPVSGTRRVRRGGSWLNHARSIRPAMRGRSTPDFRYHGTGFRSVLSSIQ